MRIFMGEWVANVLTRLGMEEGQAIESPMVSRQIQKAQKKLRKDTSKAENISSNTMRSWIPRGAGFTGIVRKS